MEFGRSGGRARGVDIAAILLLFALGVVLLAVTALLVALIMAGVVAVMIVALLLMRVCRSRLRLSAGAH